MRAATDRRDQSVTVARSRHFTKAEYDAWITTTAKGLADEWPGLTIRERQDTIDGEVGLCDWTFHLEGANQILAYTNNKPDLRAVNQAGVQAGKSAAAKAWAHVAMSADLWGAVLKEVKGGDGND